jgi:hypothetical protein
MQITFSNMSSEKRCHGSDFGSVLSGAQPVSGSRISSAPMKSGQILGMNVMSRKNRTVLSNC